MPVSKQKVNILHKKNVDKRLKTISKRKKTKSKIKKQPQKGGGFFGDLKKQWDERSILYDPKQTVSMTQIFKEKGVEKMVNDMKRQMENSHWKTVYELLEIYKLLQDMVQVALDEDLDFMAESDYLDKLVVKIETNYKWLKDIDIHEWIWFGVRDMHVGDFVEAEIAYDMILGNIFNFIREERPKQAKDLDKLKTVYLFEKEAKNGKLKFKK